MTFNDQTKVRWMKCVGCNEFINAIARSPLCAKCDRQRQWNQIRDMTYRELCAQDDWEYNEKHYGDEESA